MTEEIILDCSGATRRGCVTKDDRGLIQKKIKYDFRIIRVECRVKWKFTQARAGGDKYADLKLKCGSTKKRAIKFKQRPAKATWTLASCEKSFLDTVFALTPDGVHALWQKKNAGNFLFQNLYLLFEGSDFSRHSLHFFQVIAWLCTTTSLLAVKWNTKN